MSNHHSSASDFNWSHFVQVELHQLQIKESLEATLREAETQVALDRQQAGASRSLISFIQKAKPAPNQAEATVKMSPSGWPKWRKPWRTTTANCTTGCTRG